MPPPSSTQPFVIGRYLKARSRLEKTRVARPRKALSLAHRFSQRGKRKGVGALSWPSISGAWYIALPRAFASDLGLTSQKPPDKGELGPFSHFPRVVCFLFKSGLLRLTTKRDLGLTPVLATAPKKLNKGVNF